MRCLVPALLTAFLFVLPLGAEETGEASPAGIPPLTLVLEAVEFAPLGVWRPGWSLDLPPDAFTFSGGDISGALVEAGNKAFRYYVDAEGRMLEFPLMLEGRMAQADIMYGAGREPREITLTFFPLEKQDNKAAEYVPGEQVPAAQVSTEVIPAEEDPVEKESAGAETWKFEVLEYEDSLPVLVRGSRGDAWYFVRLSRGGFLVTESWFDGEGNFSGAYSCELAETGGALRIRRCLNHFDEGGALEYHYDSRHLVTEQSGPGGVYRALYNRENMPMYRELRPVIVSEEAAGEVPAAAPDSVDTQPRVQAGNFALQWDGRGLLVRLKGGDENAAAENGETDFRYEYTFDEKGNWIERRETVMTRRGDLWVPSTGSVVKRTLEYRTDE